MEALRLGSDRSTFFNAGFINLEGQWAKNYSTFLNGSYQDLVHGLGSSVEAFKEGYTGEQISADNRKTRMRTQP